MLWLRRGETSTNLREQLERAQTRFVVKNVSGDDDLVGLGEIEDIE
jgi:hypothetical protein